MNTAKRSFSTHTLGLLTVSLCMGTGALGFGTVASAQPISEPRVEPVSAGEAVPWEGFGEPRVALLAGLIQPIALRGGNVELDFYFRRLVVGYSHGFRLKLEGSNVVGDASDQGLAFNLPYSTGLSVGYRILEWLDVRLEGKVHRFDVRHEASGDELFSYTTFTLGVGVYAQYRPFYHFGVDFPKWAQGIMMVASARYWPNVASSLDHDERHYQSPAGGADMRHQAANIGIANTPFLFNVALGYLIQF